MLSYRHRFHAGNFADVLKHVLLTRALVLLERKPKPLAYLDTHAGIGRYDLAHPWSRKLAEHRQGIERVWQRADAPPELGVYLETVRAENPAGRLRHYPGSPCIAARVLRPVDRMVLGELNEADYRLLRTTFARDPRAGVHHVDADSLLKAFLPPRERRGLVLIDPPFDRAGELARLVERMTFAHRRWATGVYALWYPLMDPRSMRGFERSVIGSGVRRVLQIELSVHPEGWRQSLRGCGLLVVNPPWGLDVEAARWLPWLWRTLAPEAGGACRVRSLVGE